MTHTPTNVPIHARRIEELVGTLEQAGDPGLVSAARDLVQSLMELHFAGLSRILEMVARSPSGPDLSAEFGSDQLVGNLLALYELHPVDLEVRVRAAVEKVQTRHLKTGLRIELLAVADGTVRIRMEGGGAGCGRAAVEEELQNALYESAPDAARLEIEATPQAAAFVPLESLVRGTSAKGAGL